MVTIAIDAVLFTVKNGALLVALAKREKQPYVGSFELYGGIVQDSETVDETLRRKIATVCGTNEFYFEQFSVFSDPHRDPRGRTISIGYVALVPYDISSSVKWYDVKSLPLLAFDHGAILMGARDYLKRRIDTSLLRHLVVEPFALNTLQEVYEVIEGKKYDNRNFRKRMIDGGVVVKTAVREKDVSHRPAFLYKFASGV
ncbi:MAG TPA: NUDIX domain-containing protein [Acidobacteriota bacterium]|nr:NUDIX domain-containing protein [Acidobacteriota bacterium]